MVRQLFKQSTWMLFAGLVMGLLVGVGMLLGTLATVRSFPAGGVSLPETLLHASASHSGKSMAMATGLIDEEVEGLFTLDYLTGDLQCYVLNSRYPTQWSGMFKYNVIQDLGVEQGKDPNYVMVTGQAQFVRGTGTQTPAMCVLYVMDANSGNFAAYSLAWNRTMARQPQTQTGTLARLQTGKARMLELRQ
jgi:hypothetical protein